MTKNQLDYTDKYNVPNYRIKTLNYKTKHFLAELSTWFLDA